MNNVQWLSWKDHCQSIGLTMRMLDEDRVHAGPSWLGKKSWHNLEFFQRLPESERFDVIRMARLRYVRLLSATGQAARMGGAEYSE